MNVTSGGGGLLIKSIVKVARASTVSAERVSIIVDCCSVLVVISMLNEKVGHSRGNEVLI
jgi:hypothetical protein